LVLFFQTSIHETEQQKNAHKFSTLDPPTQVWGRFSRAVAPLSNVAVVVGVVVVVLGGRKLYFLASKAELI
jgi:hypothetical protein